MDNRESEFGLSPEDERLIQESLEHPKYMALKYEEQAKASKVDGKAAEKLETPVSRSKQPSTADLLIDIGKSAELFHDEVNEPYARIGGVNYRLRSKEFKSWLAGQCWQAYLKAPNTDSINTALNVLEAIARFEGKEHRLEVRVAACDGAIYYDLCDPTGRAVKIDKTGWQVVDDPPNLFKRYPHMQPQVEPKSGGNIEQLLDFINVADPNHKLLLKIYTVACFQPDIAHPVLDFEGEQGSGKTSVAKIIRTTIDPSALEVLSFPHGVNGLVQKLAHNYVAPFDNLTSLSAEESDCLCRAVTGEGFSKRQLYTDDDDIVYRYRRCILLNGINIVATRPDLLDRSLIIRLDRIPPNERREEKELWARFNACLPYILGAVFDCLSKAMSIYSNVHLPELNRMADFTRWGYAIEQALARKEQSGFLRAYSENIKAQNDEAISASPVANAVVEFMKANDCWEGSPSVLYKELEAIALRLKLADSRAWPSAANWLSRRLNEIKTNLREAGIEVNLDKEGERKIYLRKVKNPSYAEGDSAEIRGVEKNGCVLY